MLDRNRGGGKLPDPFHKLFPEGDWCRCSFGIRQLIQDLSKEGTDWTAITAQAFLLCYLMNHARLVGAYGDWADFHEGREKSGVFYCTVKTMEHDIGMPKRVQERWLKALQDKKLIRVRIKYREGKRRRFIQIRRKAIYKQITGEDWDRNRE